MATNNQIIKCSNDFAAAHETLRALKDRKQLLQDELNLVQIGIDEAQLLVTAHLDTLRQMVNE